MMRAAWAPLACWGALLVGCAGGPAPGPAPAPEAPAARTPAAQFERQTRERAVLLTRQGKLGEAAQTWDVLLALRPDSREYREQRSELQRQIDAAAIDRAQRAARAQQRGELDAAMQLYLSVLAIKPEHAQAAEALRSLERERVRRQQLGRPSRLTLTRRANAEAEMAAPSGGADRNDLEHAALLAGNGELDDAIALLERHLAIDRRDDAVKASLAELYQRKADEALAGRDPAAAIGWLEKSLKLDPADADTAARLKQLRGLSPAAAAATARPAASPRRD